MGAQFPSDGLPDCECDGWEVPDCMDEFERYEFKFIFCIVEFKFRLSQLFCIKPDDVLLLRYTAAVVTIMSERWWKREKLKQLKISNMTSVNCEMIQTIAGENERWWKMRENKTKAPSISFYTYDFGKLRTLVLFETYHLFYYSYLLNTYYKFSFFKAFFSFLIVKLMILNEFFLKTE